MKLKFLNKNYAVSRLDPDSKIPTWAAESFLALSRTEDELSVIAPEHETPEDIFSERNFACFRVIGSIDFNIVGVIANISRVLSDAKIPILAISTYDTDYFLVPHADQEPARSALIAAGFEFEF